VHIAEGFLPHPWWELWYLLAIPFLLLGLHKLNRIFNHRPDTKPLLALAGAFIFVFSALKIPSVTGSCSHPTGTGLAAVLFGPAITSVLSVIVLLFQALLLAHGGISTLGANLFSMGIVGPAVGFAVYSLSKRLSLENRVAIFLAAALADLSTYVVTSAQLALAFPSSQGGIMGVLTSLKAFGAIFAVTQVPIAILEGVVTVFLFNHLVSLKGDVLSRLRVSQASGGE